jgi:AcrR family transcriptional regulator
VTTKRAGEAGKERLSRETIVDSALALTDAEGLEAVTIRRLAQDQGVTPMALYWHFRDKERLFDGIAERLLTDMVLPQRAPGEPEPSWDLRFRELLVAMVDVLRHHPAAAELVRTRIMLSEAGLDVTERALQILAEGGFNHEQAAQIAGQALGSIVLLVTAEPGLDVGLDGELKAQHRREKRARIQTLSPERYPRVVAAGEAFVVCGDSQEYFELGLDIFLAGVRGVQAQLS